MAIIVGERYEQYEAIGRGGMGVVYRGKNTLTGEAVAIKILHPDRATEEQIARFQREGAALRDLNHPNIVKMLDAFQENDDYYLIMEYVPGGDLNSLIQQGDLSPENIVAMGIDLADALTRAHKLGIIHRDLKPANVLIADDGTLRLTDFGIAHVRHQETLGDSDNIVGTVNYMAPETLSGDDVSASMDIWAFGIMFFEMLAGQVPFQRESMSATLVAITTDPIPDIRDFVPDISAGLEDLVYRMLDRDVHNRISSVRYVGAILEDIQQGRSKQGNFETRFETEPDIFSLPARNNLPEQLTEFVGREAEIDEVQRLLDEPNTRLVTILAPGGMGKTRLSLELARRNLDQHEDGVYFVELANISDVQAIVPQIAEAIGVSLSNPQQKDEDALLDFLRSKQMLLVMDNYEHLLDGANLVGTILESAPDVTIIATSRQRLQQHGETLFHLSGMDFPDWETPEDAANYAAVRLFTGSAVRSRPDFEISVENLPYIARICRMVQGMPLGIVLAAAWVAVLEPSEIASELAGGIDFLEAEEGDLPSRQQSIRVVMEYAWHMISDADRDSFMALSVFQNGFTREAASKIAGATIRQLMKFVNLSLLSRDADTGRYAIHELLRQYTLEKLEDSSEMASIQRKHAEYYAEMVADSYQGIIDAQGERISLINLEFENIKAAWFHALDLDDILLVNDFVRTMGIWIPYSNRQKEIRDIIIATYEQYQAREDIPASDKGNILTIYGCAIGFDYHDYDLALGSLARGITLLEENQRHQDLSVSYYFGAQIQRMAGNLEQAIDYARKAYETAKKSGQLSLQARAALVVGFFEGLEDHDLDNSAKWLREANELGKQAGNNRVVATTSNNLADIYFRIDDFDTAREYLMMAHDYNKTPFSAILFIYANNQLARLDMVASNIEEAETRYLESIDVAKAHRGYDVEMTALHMLCHFYVITGHYDKALGYMPNLRRLEVENMVSERNLAITNLHEALAKWGLGERDAVIPYIEGAVVPLAKTAQPQLFASVLIGFVNISAYQANYEKALATLGLLRSVSFLVWMDQMPLLQEVDAILREHFTEEDYARISAEGAELDWNTVVSDLYEEYQTEE